MTLSGKLNRSIKSSGFVPIAWGKCLTRLFFISTLSLLLSCSALRNRELWVKSKPFKCVSITEGHRDGHTVWFVQYERIDGIRVYEMCFDEPKVKVGEYTTAFLIR